MIGGDGSREIAQARALLAELRGRVQGAKSMPMSTSAVVNRAELLATMDELDSALRAAAGRDSVDQIIAAAHVSAERIVAEAQAEAARLVSERSIVAQARQQGAALLDDARIEADRLRHEVDDYVDSRLANFEVVLEKIIDAVRRGRGRLVGSTPYDRLAASVGPADPESPGDAVPPPHP